jgi:hypothetical protein
MLTSLVPRNAPGENQPFNALENDDKSANI